jgi:tRNA dimethylallyltransferase
LNTASNRSINTDTLSVILIFGPTGVGKTGLLSRLFPGRGEIINADSMQVYRGMDIGTAKPDSELLRTLPHHLIDIRDPQNQFNAGDFVDEADRLVHEISSRKSLPVICGGTAFYFRNFIYGLPNTPPGNEETRDRIQSRIDETGLSGAYAELQKLDPVGAKTIGESDTYRITRALEVIEVSGKPFSSFRVSSTPRSEFRMLIIGLDRPRNELYSRINHRVAEMFRVGLAEEVAKLISGGCAARDPGMHGIGYKEFFDMRKQGCLTLKGLEERIARNSRRYAKRQLTFFKSFSEVHWFHPDSADEIGSLINEFVN